MARMTNQYPNLPGHLVEFKDGGMALRNNDSTAKTDSVLLLGTAVDGPVMDPVAIDVTTVEALYGKEIKANGAPNGATLVKAVKELAAAGVNDIRCMRITGEIAQLSIAKAPELITTQVTIEEDLDRVMGNDLTTLTLQHAPIVTNSVKVFAKGSLVTSGVLVNETIGEVKIAANSCDAGANLQVQYEYYRTEAVTDEVHLLDSGLDAVLAYEPLGAITVTVGGVAIAPAGYTVTGKVVHVNEYAPGNPANAGDEIKVTYTGITSDVFNATESSNGATAFVAATSVQDMALVETPVSGTFHLYVDGVEMLNPLAYTVDATAKIVHVKKEYFPKASNISVGYSYTKVETITESIKLESYFGGEVYNRGSVAVRQLLSTTGAVLGILVEITKPVEKRVQVTEAPLQYNSIDYPTFGALVEAINNDANNGVYKAKTDYPAALTEELVINVSPTNNVGANFVGGDDGLTVDKNKLFKALSGERDADGYLLVPGAYQLLEDYQVDWVVPLGVYADDELSGRYQNFAYELALFCTILSYRNKITLGAIDVKPCADTTLAGIKAYGEHLASMPNTYLMRDDVGNIMVDSENQPIDLGGFLSVVGGPEPVHVTKNLGRYFGSAAVAYVALNSTINVHSAPTNKKLAAAKGLRFRFSNQQHNAIVGNRIVTFKTKFDKAGATNGDAYVVDGVTAARTGSDYARVTTTKVLRETIDQIRTVAEPFIGEPNTNEQRNALGSAISKRLTILKEKGVILDYEFSISASIEDQILGQAKIELTIVAPQELRKITTVVGLKA
jgi:hypothetical protein